MVNNQISNSQISTNSYISEDWYGGYKIELDLTAETAANDWSVDFDFPYTIRAA